MQKKIIIDCERMKYPYTGLYHYCNHLSNALVEQQPVKNDNIAFYIPPSVEGFLGAGTKYEIQKWWHKLYNPIAGKYDLWHGTYQGSNYYPQSRKVKKMLTIHDLNFLFDEHKTAAKQKRYLQNIQEQINRSDQLSVISAFTLQCIKDNLIIGGTPVEIIYNGCNMPENKDGFEQPGFINKTIPFIFSIGTIAEKKNFHTLPGLLVGNDYNLIIAGIIQDEDYLEKIKAAAKKHGVQDRLILPGSVTESEKWWLMQNMVAFVFPSLAEGFGLPVVEAMNFGKPILLSIHTSLPEIGSTAAYYFNSFDSEDMQITFRNSLDHFNTHSEQSNVIRKRAAFFNWDEAAKQYWRLYQNLIQ